MELAGKKIVVTGGAGALGRSVVRALGERGADVVVLDKPDVDLTVEAQVIARYAALGPLWGSIHVAGGYAAAPLLDTTLAAFRGQLELNATTCFLCCREAVRSLRASGGGRIVNVASRAALVPAGGMPAYIASKAAVVALTQAVAAETLADGILVNAVAPSIMDTPANRAAMPDADFSKWPKTDDVAETIVFLASPKNALTSGAIVPVYGRA